MRVLMDPFSINAIAQYALGIAAYSYSLHAERFADLVFWFFSIRIFPNINTHHDAAQQHAFILPPHHPPLPTGHISNTSCENPNTEAQPSSVALLASSILSLT
jgi:hypothetical protein